MIHNVLMTTLTPLSDTNEITCWQNRPFTTVWPEQSQQKSKAISKSMRKKPKRARTAFSTNQVRALEKMFSRFKYIDSERRRELAKNLNIGEKCVKIWFQNRRMKEKRESSESSCSDSSSELLGVDTHTNAASPDLPEIQTDQISINPCYPNQFAQGTERYFYHLPTYHYQTNDYQPNLYESVQGTNASGFYYDNNIYPTQYYPNSNNYFTNDDNGIQNEYGNTIHNSWTPQNSYFCTE